MRRALSNGSGLRQPLAFSLGLHVLLLLGIDSDDLTVARQTSAIPMKGLLVSSGTRLPVPAPSRTEKSPKASHNSKLPAPGRAAMAAAAVSETVVATARGAATPPPPVIGGMASSAATVDTVTPAAGASSQEGISADAVRQYLLLLVPEARRFKRYPRLARERGWEGTAEITVRLGRGQSEPVAALTRSSGFPILDEQALATIGQAVRLVAVPESLRGRDVSIAVPVRFSLED